MLCCVGEAADDDARQSVLALEPNQMLAESNDIEDQAARLMRDDLDPIRDTGTGDRGLTDAEILRAVRVGRDDQPIAAVIDAIFVSVTARLDDSALACRASASIR